MMIEFTLTLNYQLNAGWLSPFIEGLRNGKLMARQCTACSRTSLPPTRSCTCGSHDGNWVVLNGTASILKRTTGSDGDFALVRFDGADTMSVVAMDSLPSNAKSAVVKLADSKLPSLTLTTAPALRTRHDID